MDSKPALSIIIVNLNTRELLEACLRSVENTAQNLNVEIWVIDNGSTDGSVDMIVARFPAVQLIVNTLNLGFAKGNNQGLSQIAARHALLLNSDTVVLPNALESIITLLDADPALGVVGVQLLNADGSLQPSCGNFPTVWTEFLFQTFLFKIIPSSFPYGRKVHPLQVGDYQRERYVDWVTGAALAIRAEVIQQVGVLDDTLFMYGEDLDWCWRIKHRGYKVKFCPDAKVIHYVGTTSHRDFARWIVNYTQGTLHFFTRYHSKIELKAISGLIMIGCVLRFLVSTIVASVLSQRRQEAIQRRNGYRSAFQLAFRTFVRGQA